MTKYIDGKKVEVVQELNSTQTIVKEIFIDDNGAEIPHGECFTVATSKLSDSPLAAWKELHLKQHESEWEKTNREWQKKIDDAKSKLKLEYDKVYHLTKSVQGMAASLGQDASMQFIRLLDFMSGRIKWVVINHWQEPKIVPIDEFIDKYMCYYDRDVSVVKLLTIFGSPNRDGKHRGLNFRLNEYPDGSGSSTEIFVFNEEEEAVEKAREILSQVTYVNDWTIAAAEKYGAELDPEKVKKYWSHKRSSVQNDLDKHIEGLTACKKKLEEINTHL